MDLDDMGANWPGTRDAAREGTLRRTDDARREIAQRWDQVMRFAALRLGSHIGVDVQPVVPRAHADPTESSDREPRDRWRAGRNPPHPGTAGEPLDIAVGRCAVIADSWGNQLVILDNSKGRLLTDEAGNVTGVAP
jgi:hypothetical protein